MNDNLTGIIVILGLVAIALFGGSQNARQPGGGNSLVTAPQTQAQKQQTLAQQIQVAQSQVEDLKKSLETEEQRKTESIYKGLVTIQYIARSNDPGSEYVTLKLSSIATTSVSITGWTLKSLSSGATVSIPKGTYLIFAGSVNTEDPIVLAPGDIAYIVTGFSPNGYSFKSNKCSGYMGQFQTFVPYLYTSCPAPRDENLSSIPTTVNNDACFDYINTMPACRIQTAPLPISFSTECQNFITTKINYSSCVTTHKNDADFYGNEWRIYLKRSNPIWKTSRESVVLLDNIGKVVDTFKY